MPGTYFKRLGQFSVVLARCGSPLHASDTPPTFELCVRIGGIFVCADCVMEYHEDFAEAVEEWECLRVKPSNS
jgi:hypothetical protein